MQTGILNGLIAVTARKRTRDESRNGDRWPPAKLGPGRIGPESSLNVERSERSRPRLLLHYFWLSSPTFRPGYGLLRSEDH
jgi:hypothetical protein